MRLNTKSRKLTVEKSEVRTLEKASVILADLCRLSDSDAVIESAGKARSALAAAINSLPKDE